MPSKEKIIIFLVICVVMYFVIVPIIFPVTDDVKPVQDPTCLGLGGQMCATDQICSGSSIIASDSNNCCNGTCAVVDVCGDGKCSMAELEAQSCLLDCTEDTPLIENPCGDGDCDEFERQNPETCPQDCGGEQLTDPCVDSCIASGTTPIDCFEGCGVELPPLDPCMQNCTGPEQAPPLECYEKCGIEPPAEGSEGGTGYCGDGDCDDFERSSGMCQQDCP